MIVGGIPFLIQMIALFLRLQLDQEAFEEAVKAVAGPNAN
jgi:hypothetical protein